MCQARVPPANREMGTQPAPSIPSHDDARFRHRLADRFVGQHAGPIEVEFVVNDDIFTQHRHVLHAHLGGEGMPGQRGKKPSLPLPHPAQPPGLPTGPRGSANPQCRTQARSGSGCGHPAAPCTAGCTHHLPPPHQGPGSRWGQCYSCGQCGHSGPKDRGENTSEALLSQA